MAAAPAVPLFSLSRTLLSDLGLAAEAAGGGKGLEAEAEVTVAVALAAVTAADMLGREEFCATR